MFGAVADTPLPQQKRFSKYAHSLFTESYSVNVDILEENTKFVNFLRPLMPKIVSEYDQAKPDIDPIVTVI